MAATKLGDKTSDPIWVLTRHSHLPVQAPYRIIYTTWNLEQSVLSPDPGHTSCPSWPRAGERVGSIRHVHVKLGKGMFKPHRRLTTLVKHKMARWEGDL